MCRRKGRVVLVGDVGLAPERSDMYQKELDFFISHLVRAGSLRPGYEEGGLDYPDRYVRWTENRNMAEYLRLVADGPGPGRTPGRCHVPAGRGACGV